MTQVFITGWVLCNLTVKQGSETYHFGYSYKSTNSAPPTDAELLTIATNVFNIMAPALAPILHTSCSIVSCSCRDMSSAFGHEAVYTPGSAVPGTATGDSEPANVAAVMTYNPATVGKGVKGRTFISGFGDGATSGNVFTSGLVTALVALAAGLRAYAGPVGLPLIASIASRKHVLLRTILSSTVSAQIDNQIRRLIGHRRHKRHVSTP